MKTRIDPLDADKAASRRDFESVQQKFGFSAHEAIRRGGYRGQRQRQKEMVRIVRTLNECEQLDKPLPPWKGPPAWLYNTHYRKR